MPNLHVGKFTSSTHSGRTATKSVKPEILASTGEEKRTLQALLIPYTLTGFHKTLQLMNWTYFPDIGIAYGLESFVRNISRLIPRKSKLSCGCKFPLAEAM